MSAVRRRRPLSCLSALLLGEGRLAGALRSHRQRTVRRGLPPLVVLSGGCREKGRLSSSQANDFWVYVLSRVFGGSAGWSCVYGALSLKMHGYVASFKHPVGAVQFLNLARPPALRAILSIAILHSVWLFGIGQDLPKMTSSCTGKPAASYGAAPAAGGTG